GSTAASTRPPARARTAGTRTPTGPAMPPVRTATTSTVATPATTAVPVPRPRIGRVAGTRGSSAVVGNRAVPAATTTTVPLSTPAATRPESQNPRGSSNGADPGRTHARPAAASSTAATMPTGTPAR